MKMLGTVLSLIGGVLIGVLGVLNMLNIEQLLFQGISFLVLAVGLILYTLSILCSKKDKCSEKAQAS